MRNTLYLVLTAAGLAGLILFLTRRSASGRKSPMHEAERLLDRCQDMLVRIESAAGKFQSPEAPAS